MDAVEVWRSRPVFVTSTFQDMQAERDELLLHVFPAVEEWLAPRRRHLEWVDLRVGVSTVVAGGEASRELKVLKVCLDEVRRSRPFIIGLLGDRYGWVPPVGRITTAAVEAGFDAEVAGRSVTELEIAFGVLADLAQSRRSLLFLRAPLPYDGMSPELAAAYCDAMATDPEAAERTVRLAELKARLRREVPERCFEYEAIWDPRAQRVTGLGSWGRMVEAQLRAALEDEFVDDPAPTELDWHEVEREALADFIENRARGFIGRTDIVERLETVLASSPDENNVWGVCVTGEAGSGKTALFGEMYKRLHARDVFVLAHSPGGSTRGASVGLMMQRFIVDFMVHADAVHLYRYTVEGEIIEGDLVTAAVSPNATEENIYALFGLLLPRMAERQRVVILMDALNQMEPISTARFINWIKENCPPNTRLLTTTIEGDASAALSEHPGIALLPLPPLDDTEARAIAQGICRRYHRDLEPVVMNALIAKRGPGRAAWAIPLWLVIAAEELNLLDADDFARAKRDYQGRDDERLTALMCDLITDLPADVQGIYRAGIARAEAIFGRRLVCAFLATITVSRFGWRETDFRVLLPKLSGQDWDELGFASLRRLFRGHLRRHEPLGRWDFVHRQMRLGAGDWLAHIGADEMAAHAAIVDHLLALPANDPLRISEVMVHLLGSGDWARAANYLGGGQLDEAGTAGARHVLVDMILSPNEHAAEHAARKQSHLLEVEGIGDAVRSHVANHLLNVHYRTQGRCSVAAQEITLLAVENCIGRLVLKEPKNRRYLEQHAVSLVWLGILRKEQGDLEGSLTSYRRATEVREGLAALDPDDARRREQISGHGLNIGDALLAKGDLEGALACYRDPAHAENSAAHSRIGAVLRMRGDLNGAVACFRTGIAILERDLKRTPADQVAQLNLGIAHSTIGSTLVAMNDFAGALEFGRTAKEIIGRVAAQNPMEPRPRFQWALTHILIAQALQGQSDRQGARESLISGWPILERLVAQYPDNPDYGRYLAGSITQLGDVLHSEGDDDRALACWRSAAQMLELLAAHDRTNSACQQDLAATLLRIDDALRPKEEAGTAPDRSRQNEGDGDVNNAIASTASHSGWFKRSLSRWLPRR